MTTRTAPETAIESAGFKYQGIEIPALSIDKAIISHLGTPKEARELTPLSIPYAWKVGLYLAGRDQPDLPESAREAGKLVYDYCQERNEQGSRKMRGAWHKDGILYLRNDETPRGWSQPKKGEVLAIYFRDIAGFKETSKGHEIIPSEDTQDFIVKLPRGQGHFAVPTSDGLVDPRTGTYLETVEEKKEAIKRWMDTGLTEEQSRNELSRFYRANSGLHAVCSLSSDDSGPLDLYLDDEPRYWGPYIGSFSASRLASGASRDPGITIPKNEYRTIVDKAGRFDRLAAEFDRLKK